MTNKLQLRCTWRLCLSSCWLGLVSSVVLAGPEERNIRNWKRALAQPDGWYASADAERIAHNVLAYQRESGGWPKNTNMARLLDEHDLEQVESERALADSTIDNGATTEQIVFLSRIANATGKKIYQKGVSRGVDYLLAAQYENGGWPMFYPPKRGYYEHITFNDGSMIAVLRVLASIVNQNERYEYLSSAQRARAAIAVEKGIQAILACQVWVNGKRTAWCAQHDRETLEPAKARSYELPSLSGNESVGIVRFLMDIDSPSEEVIDAIEGAVAWFDKAKITGQRLDRVRNPEGKHGYDVVVTRDASAPPLWARFYEIGTNRPMFVGRDGVVKDDLTDIEIERRTGYTYLGSWGERLLEKDYPAWKRRVGTR